MNLSDVDFIWKVQSWSTKGKFGLDAAGMHSPDDFFFSSSSSQTQHAPVLLEYIQSYLISSTAKNDLKHSTGLLKMALN